MVHTFSCLGRFFVVDTESGSLFETDELTNKLISQKNSPDSFSEGDFSDFSNEDITIASREIDSLIKESVLFSKPPSYVEPPQFDGVIKALCLNVSHHCNLNCRYCFAREPLADDKAALMPFDIAKAAVDFLIAKSGKRRNLEIDFFGGEPLLNMDVVKKTVSYARSLEAESSKHFRFTMTTNGLLLTDTIIDFLNREMDNVIISIDGREQIHNSMRRTKMGADTYGIVLENAMRFKEKRGNKPYYIRGTFTRNNLDFAADALDLFDRGFDKISLEPVVLPRHDSLSIRERDLDAIKHEYEWLAGTILERRKKGVQWSEFFHFNLDIYQGPCESKRLKSCGAGCEYLAVTPDGYLYPCHQFAGESIYKVGHILDSKKLNKDTQLYFSRKNHIYAKPECKSCWAKYYCSGGCAASSVHFEGEMIKPHKISCELMKKRIECALAITAIESE